MNKLRKYILHNGVLYQILAYLLLCFIINIFSGNNTHATTASITINGNIDINHQWGAEGINFKDYYKHLEVTTKTDSPTGYQLYFSSASEENALISTNANNSQKIESVTGSYNDSSYIERIYVSDTFVTTNVTASSGIFGGSFDNLRGQQGTSVPGHDISYAHVDGGPSNPGAFWKKP